LRLAFDAGRPLVKSCPRIATKDSRPRDVRVLRASLEIPVLAGIPKRHPSS
jgi:hypothetical protein